MKKVGRWSGLLSLLPAVLVSAATIAADTVAVAGATPAAVKNGQTTWRTLAPRLDLATIQASRPSILGDSRITVVRIDPALWELVVVGTSMTGETSGRAAREWARSHQLTIAINAGMFGSYETGFLESDANANPWPVPLVLGVRPPM